MCLGYAQNILRRPPFTHVLSLDVESEEIFFGSKNQKSKLAILFVNYSLKLTVTHHRSKIQIISDKHNIFGMNRENQHEIPEIRTCYRMTNLREYLVISVGGDCRSSATYNDLWIYNTISGMWKHNQPIIELGTICEYSEIYSFGNKVYIFGYDHLYKPHRKIPCLVSFNVNDTNWETVYIHNEDKDENEPPYMCVNLFYYHNKSLYVLGTLHRDDISINSNYSDENDSSEDSTNIESENSVVMYKFCLVTSTWTLVQQTGVKPIFYGQAYATVFNNQLFMFCRESTATTKFREVNILDLSTYVWARRETQSKNKQCPYARVGESYAFSSNCAFMSGGRTLNNNASYEDIWRIELETLEWIQTGLFSFYKNPSSSHLCC
ncbi:hypothetical protein RF11_04296 [Thelohanellus kitauei]|uniref:Kelch domain-containing protein 10 n=1 Tax=Thelohanellus kitauei TaxID=669202 RepID=A0A0C2NHG4_THEKT|nr:hypothetical protein RF11_04296 [Thelohanellus kitauei]